VDSLHLERYEYKYFVPEELSEPIRRFIRPYTTVDPYAAGTPGHRYTIHNLYLDTPGLDLYHGCVDGDPDRYKLRIRWYDEAAEGPFFFEVKRKVRQVVVKDRAGLSRNDACDILAGGRPALPDGLAAEAAAAFRGRLTLSGAVPTIYSRYTREPYESAFGEYARLTLDRAMAYQPARTLGLREPPKGWTYVDAAWAVGGLRRALVLELKFTHGFPRWMSDLVAEFDLERIGYSKYVSSIRHRLDREHGGVESDRVSALGGGRTQGRPAAATGNALPGIP
jgi:hypothetical protein